MTEPIYTTDPYRRILETSVTAAGEDQEGRPWVELAATLFYPGGGGQPPDQGRIGPARVVAIQAIGDGGVRYVLDRPVPVGPVRLELDWERRYDHMQQHTGQHLLTAVCEARCGWRTVSFHLGREEATIDLDQAELPPAHLREVVAEVQARIRKALPVRVLRLPRETLKAQEVRVRELPARVGREVRVVEIEGTDRTACGGTHVASTAELQLCHVLGTEKVRGRTRLRFVFGGRALARLEAMAAREAALRRLLGTHPEEFLPLLQARAEERRRLGRRTRRLQAALARLAGADLARSVGPLAAAHLPGADPAALALAAEAALAANTRLTVALLGDDEGNAFFLVRRGPEGVVSAEEVGRRLATLLAGRGGGNHERYQGRGEVRCIPAALAALTRT